MDDAIRKRFEIAAFRRDRSIGAAAYAEYKAAEDADRLANPYTKDEKRFVSKLRRMLQQCPDSIALVASPTGGISVYRRRLNNGEMIEEEWLDAINCKVRGGQ